VSHIKYPLNIVNISVVALLLMTIMSWSSILSDNYGGILDILKSESRANLWSFAQQLAGTNLDREHALFNLEYWQSALYFSLETIRMSVLAIGIAGIFALMTFLHGSRNIVNGELPSFNRTYRLILFRVIRTLFIITRGTPELLIAMLLIFVLSPGILPGAIALAIHNYGILGKLSSELVENLDQSPIEALKANGSNNYQILFYGIFPQVLPQFLTYLTYRWEVITRTTIVVGLVSAGGLGREFMIRMSWFQYDRVLVLLICYISLVILIDLISIQLRKLIT